MSPISPIRPMTVIEKHQEAQLKSSAGEGTRLIAAVEVASVMLSVIVVAWIILPLQPDQPWLALLPALGGLALIVHSQWVRGENARLLGLGPANFLKAIKLLGLPMVAAAAIIVSVGVWANSFHYTSHFRLVLVLLPLWGLIQQYVLQGFVYRRLRYAMSGHSHAIPIIVTALLFALAHAPNLVLMGLTLAGGLVWTWTYDRAPNLLALALSHALMSLLIMTSWPPWLLESMGIGFRFFFRQRPW